MLSLHSRRAAAAAARAVAAAAPAVPPRGSRAFWNISMPVVSGPGGPHITKYQVVMPAKDGVEYDDFLLALPEKEDLASFTKEVPLFLRYLKVVTDAEERSADFVAFLERAKSGLVVESDVFITSEELLAVMWKNGFSEQERNAVQFTFPADYKFHYPELAAMFALQEEDAYQFCMRSRTEASHIGALDFDKVKMKGLLRTHWLIFGTGIVIFKYFPFFNYYFGMKVFGTSMVCTSFWLLFNRTLAKTIRRNEYMAQQKTAQEVMDGQDAIIKSMQRFQNDSKVVEYLGGFKEETEEKIATYKAAYVQKMKEDMTERALRQLQSIATFEAGMGSAMQELVVREAASAFREKFPTDHGMQAKAFQAALKGLAGDTVSPGDDPVASHFEDAFKSLQGVDLMTTKGDPAGSLAQRLAYAQQTKEQEFKTTFMVTKEEASEVKKIAQEAGPGIDLAKLSAKSKARLEELYNIVNAKVGYALPAMSLDAIPTTSDPATTSYINAVNEQLAVAATRLHDARLKAFAQAF